MVQDENGKPLIAAFTATAYISSVTNNLMLCNYSGGFSVSEENYILRHSSQDIYWQSAKGGVEEVDLTIAHIKDKISIYLFVFFQSFIHRCACMKLQTSFSIYFINNI